MNTRWLLGSSAILLAGVGLAATFAPVEILAAAGAPAPPPVPVVLQLFGAACCAFAFANWTAKDSLFGGIYARPLVVADALFFTMSALTLGKGAVRAGSPAPLLVAAAVDGVFALFFLRAMFGSPVRAARPPADGIRSPESTSGA